MAVRREKVILDLEDNFTKGVLAAAGATKLLDHELADLNRSTVLTHQHVRQFVDDDNGGLRAMSKNAGIANSEFEDLSARTLILADSLAMLVPTIAPLGAVAVPGIMGIANALGFAIVATGGAILAFQGVFDALDKVNKAALEPTETNLKNANLAMEQLSPAAQQLVSHLQELRPAFAELRDASANGLFPGIDKSLDSFERLLPTLEGIAFTVGDVSGEIAAAGAKSLASDRWRPFFTFLENEARPTLMQTAQTVGDLAHGLAEMWMAFQPLNSDVGQVFADAAMHFDRWAAGLAKTQGFQDFVDYVRRSGPQVADTLGAIANAIIQIVEALGPVGGPALHALEQLATAIGLIADSPLGPTILAGVAAMATMRMGARLLKSTLDSGPVRSFRDLKAALLEMNAASKSVMAGSMAAQTERFAVAARSARGALMELGKPAALVAGLAFASSDAADSMGMMNTASLAMMGLMVGGGWGAAVGGAVGIVLDLAAANKKGEEAARDFADTLDQQTGAITENSRAWVANQIGSDKLAKWKEAGVNIEDLTTALLQGGDAWEQYQAQTAAALDGSPVDKVTSQPNPSYKGGGKAPQGASNSASFVNDTNDIAQAVADGVDKFNIFGEAVNGSATSLAHMREEAVATVEAMRALREEALRSENAELNWHSALLDIQDALKNNKHTLNENTRDGIANRKAILDAAAAWNDLSDAAKNAPGAYRQAKKALVDAMVQFGMNRRAARDYANTLLEIPSKIYTKVTASTDAAKREVESFRSWLARQNLDKVGHIRMVNSGGMGPQPSLWTGGYTGSGGVHDPAGVVHRGELVIPQWLEQRDRGHLKSRYGGLLPGYADGGLVGASPMAGTPMAEPLRDLGAAARDSANAIKDEVKARRDAAKQRRSDAASTVSGLFNNDPFATDSVWSNGADPMGVLAGDTASIRMFSRYIHQLRGKGLNGAALNSIYTAQDPMAAAAQMSHMSRAQLRRYELAFNKRARLSHQLGNFAGAAAYGGAGGGLGGGEPMAELARIRVRLTAIHRELASHPERTGAAVGGEIKSSVKAGDRRRRRDGKGTKP